MSEAGRTGDPVAASLPHTAETVPVVNLANALTVFRILLVPVFVVVLFVDDGNNDWWRTAAFVIFAVAAITDQIDGRIARAWNLVTDFGKLADPIADKALIGAALISLSVLGVVPWWMTVVILVREIGVTLLRFWVVRHGVIAASQGGKLKTMLQSIAIGLYVLPAFGALHTVAEVIMYAAIAVTLATGLDYVWRALRLRRGAGASA
ncbi:CDP-diacylglycerol--glycerol-3-phosphate 3-phosphatidyltransferase [Gordonia sp. VNK21]|uniref:CDP-diacylglycerol--glycerol-3-phosphate 3-phosphatidyltransferase n=1 Tax=Gordonia sp. VNK21 TaxID=3382483 RepID=UPI0038D37C88